MTHDELIAKIKKLDAAATEGPWRAGYVRGDMFVYKRTPIKIELFITTGEYDDDGPVCGMSDIDFMARSRTLLPEAARRLEVLANALKNLCPQPAGADHICECVACEALKEIRAGE